MYDNSRNNIVRRKLAAINVNHMNNENKIGIDNQRNLDGVYSGGLDTEVEKLYKKQVPKIGGGMEMQRYKRYDQPIPLFGRIQMATDNINMASARLQPPHPMQNIPLDNYDGADDAALIGEGWVDSALKLGSKAVALGTKMAPKIQKALPYIKKGLSLTKEITGAIDNDKSQKISKALGSLGFGKDGDTPTNRRAARGQMIKKIMAEKGLKMVEASKYIKEHNIQY